MHTTTLRLQSQEEGIHGHLNKRNGGELSKQKKLVVSIRGTRSLESEESGGRWEGSCHFPWH